MRSFWPIYKRELFAFFVTPLAWVLIVVFLLAQGMHFFLLVDHFSRGGADARRRRDAAVGVLREHRAPLPGSLRAGAPDDDAPLRRRAPQRHDRDADDRAGLERRGRPREVRRGADDLRRDVAADGALPRHPRARRPEGQLDWHAAASAYLGVFLVGAGYLAVGLCASALTRSQFLAMVFTALVLLSLFILGVGEFVAREGTTLHDVCAHVSVWAHMNDFASGIVDSRHLVFYATLVALPLFVATRAVDAWRWG